MMIYMLISIKRTCFFIAVSSPMFCVFLQRCLELWVVRRGERAKAVGICFLFH